MARWDLVSPTSKARPESRWMSSRTAPPAWIFTIPKADCAPHWLSARLGRRASDYTMSAANCAPVLMCPRPIRRAWPFTTKTASPPGEFRSHPRHPFEEVRFMRRLVQSTLILVLLCCAASGFGEPGYGYYGHPGYGYAPYSYGWPVYTRGYSPVFIDHHPWEDHHYGGGHHQTFGGGHPGGLGGGGHMGGFGGGHGGGGHGGGHR